MHLGLTPWNIKDLSAQGLTEQAQFAEALGYQSFWLPENHFNDSALPDPLMLLAGVAAGTHRIKLGATSYLLTIRNPLLAAEQVAVLDQLSGGRVVLGVGRGYASEMFKAFNVEPRAKRRVFEANLDLMRRAWAGQAIPVVGDDDATVLVKPNPFQRPHPPIWIAAFGPKALDQAGRLGMPYLASPIETIDALRRNFAVHGEAVAAAGHEPVSARPIMRMLFISDNARETKALREQLVRHSQSAFRHADENVDSWAIVGAPGYAADKLAEYKQELAPTHLIVTRLRVPGIADEKLRDSLTRVAELFEGNGC